MIDKIKNNPRLKKFVIGLISPHKHPRPRLWVRWLVNPFVHKKGRGALIRRHARLDVFPWRRFEVGRDALIEDYAVVNNGAGDVLIGDAARIGIGSVVIGPVRMATAPDWDSTSSYRASTTAMPMARATRTSRSSSARRW